jgi:hypothetical protein
MAPARKSVLFLTNSEYGQANVAFAIAYEFLLRNEFDIHIASYATLETRVHQLNKEISLTGSGSSKGVNLDEFNAIRQDDTTKAVFHKVPGLSAKENAMRQNIPLGHKPGLWHAPKAFKDMSKALIRSDAASYIQSYRHCLEIIHNLRPSVVIVDPIFFLGVDACKTSGVQYMKLYPTSFMDIIGGQHPRGAIFWKYPA